MEAFFICLNLDDSAVKYFDRLASRPFVLAYGDVCFRCIVSDVYLLLLTIHVCGFRTSFFVS